MSTGLVADLGLGHVRIEAQSDLGIAGAGAEYGPPDGLPTLREAVAAWEGVRSEEIAITTGASLGLAATLAILERPGSVLCPRPYYPAYPKLAEMLGLEVIYYYLEPARGWQPDPDRLGQLVREDTRAVLWNFPNNPTGSLPTPALLEVMKDLVRRADLLVISDEVYADFVHDGAPAPDMAAALGSGAVVRLRSFSKLFGMPGERLGYAVTDPCRLQAISRAHWTLAMSPPTTAQTRALMLLRSKPRRRLQRVRELLAANRDRAVQILAGCDRIKLIVPPAGIFCWLEVVDCRVDSRALAHACAADAGVVVVPGAAFGVDSPTYLRASFAVSEDEVTRGFEALVTFIRSL
jgi:aminotransferase